MQTSSEKIYTFYKKYFGRKVVYQSNLFESYWADQAKTNTEVEDAFESFFSPNIVGIYEISNFLIS